MSGPASGIGPTCIHGWKEGDCPTCAACAACDGRCGTCPYLTASRANRAHPGGASR